MMTFRSQLQLFLLDSAIKISKLLWNKLRALNFIYISQVLLFGISFCCLTICDSDAPAQEKYLIKNDINSTSKTVSNFMHLKKHLLSAGFDEHSIAKVIQNIAKVIGWDWYDQRARIEVHYETYGDKKYITKAEFKGAGKIIKLNYKDSAENSMEQKMQNTAENICYNVSDSNEKNNYAKNSSMQSSPEKKHLVVMKGFINTTLERMILNSPDLPFTLRKKVIKFAQDARIHGNKGERFACLYDPQDYSIMAMFVGSDSGKKTAILFKSQNGQKLFSSDGVALRSEKLVFLRPVPQRINSAFGYRFHPVLKIYRFHYGIDFAAPRGTPIRSAADGLVIFAGHKGGYGYCVQVKHGNITTLYGHMQRIPSSTYVGKKVRAGETLGLVGSTGLASGPHLHYEIWVNGKKVNPANFSQETSQKLKGEEMVTFQAYSKKIMSYFG